MSNVGTLTVKSDSGGSTIATIEFVNVNFPDGWPQSQIQRQVEPITAMGVDGTRERVIREDYKRFRMITLTESLSFDSAITLQETIRAAKGHRSTLSVTAAGVVYSFGGKTAYVWEVQSSPMSVDLASTIASSDSHGLIQTEWTLQFVPNA